MLQFAFIGWGAFCLVLGMVLMAIVRVERGDLDDETDIDMMEEEQW